MSLRFKLWPVFLIIGYFSFSQNINGSWKGDLKISNTTLTIAFNVKKSESGYSATMDSPSQNAYGIPVKETSLKDSIVVFKIDRPKISYSGKLVGANKLIGEFKQGNTSLPLELLKVSELRNDNSRPQEPLKPFPYVSEDVVFKNENSKINLSGTLTIPKTSKVSKVVILLSGSGPQNRDEEAFGHKPFLVLSDYLTRNGVAVLRYDDRGTAKSEGDYKSASLQDFASDALAAISYIKSRTEFNNVKIGIIGHSEGGTIAPMIARTSKYLDFIISLAGTVLRGDEILLLQQRFGGIEAGASEEILEKSRQASNGAYQLIQKHKNTDKLKAKLETYLSTLLQDTSNAITEKQNAFIKKQVSKLSGSWMTSFVRYNPLKDIKKLKIPYIAFFGKKDTQVPAKENINALSAIDNYQEFINVIEFEGVNHLFQECSTGSPKEYAEIKQTFSPKVLKTILENIGKI